VYPKSKIGNDRRHRHRSHELQRCSAQQPKRVAAIGYLAISTVSAHAPRVEALRQGLRRPGYVEGQNIINESGDQPAVRMVELK